MRCNDCGFDNPEGEEYCQACGLILGQKVRDFSVEALSGRYVQFRAAVEKVKKGEWTPAEFAEYLEKTSAVMASIAKEIMEIIETSKYAEDGGAEEAQAGTQGIQCFEKGMEEMWQFSQDEDASHLESGLALAYQGTQLIIHAMYLNRESRKRLMEEWERLQSWSAEEVGE